MGDQATARSEERAFRGWERARDEARAALGIADRGYVIETGRIVMEGSAEYLLSNRDVQRAYLGRDLDAEGLI